MPEMKAPARTAYGGQAVIEGVMIRGKERYAVAVRLKDGRIITRRGFADTMLTRHAWLRMPFLRGLPALIDSLRLGMDTLTWAADQAMEGEQQEKPTPLHYALTIAAALALGIGLFVLLPNFVTSLIFHPSTPPAPGAGALPPLPAVAGVLPALLSEATLQVAQVARHAAGTGFWVQFMPTPQTILPNLLEGLMRLAILVGYILVIARNAEIRRVFAYHGAEHKAVNAYEVGGAEALTVDGVRHYSRIHPRCGTSFIVLIIVVGVIVHALVGWPDNKLLLLASRLVLLVPIVSIAYELIRLAGRFRNTALLTAVVWPGLLLQRLTTAEPTDDQIEVALTSLRTVLEDEGVLESAPVAEAIAAEFPAESARPAVSSES